MVGAGDTASFLPPTITKYFKDKGVTVESMSRRNAVDTFNVLNQEGRLVAIGILKESQDECRQHVINLSALVQPRKT